MKLQMVIGSVVSASLCAMVVASCGKSEGVDTSAGPGASLADAQVDAETKDVTVGDSGQQDAQTFDVFVAPDSGTPTPADSIPPECAAAANKGLAWLVSQQQGDGSWPTGLLGNYAVAATGLAVLKLETHAWEHGVSPFDPSYQYQQNVVKGLDYIFKQLQTHGMSGALDTNADGLGVSYPSTEEGYESAIVLMAIAAGKSPARLVDAQGSAVYGMPYQQVAQDMVDYFANCQVAGIGGWRYTCGSTTADNSVSQYVSLALEYAEHPEYKFECQIPQSVRDGLWTWVGYIQNMGPGPTYGSSGYDAPSSGPNAYKTGALLQQFAFLGQGGSSVQVQAAMTYLAQYWDQTFEAACGCATSWRGDPADYMAMWSIMKGLIAQDMDKVGGVDWYADFCKVLVDQQTPTGAWPSMGCDAYVSANGVLSTEWALLVLEKAAPPPIVTPH